MTKIDSFIAALSETQAPKNAFNMYFLDNPYNEIRRNNLKLYLEEMARRKPDTLIVGEAPGYRGCRWTGVSFCSEHLILSGIPKINMFGRDKGYKKTKEWDKPWKEPSATIVWGALSEVKSLPLIWASYPFHPYKSEENILTNRAPTNEELKLGEKFLKELIAIYDIKRIIAVGNKAELTLANLGYQVPKIRHPANGGATEFRKGIKKYFK